MCNSCTFGKVLVGMKCATVAHLPIEFKNAHMGKGERGWRYSRFVRLREEPAKHQRLCTLLGHLLNSMAKGYF